MILFQYIATKIELGIPRFCAFTLIYQINLINQNSTIRNEIVTLTNTPHGSLRIIHSIIFEFKLQRFILIR